MEAQDRRPFGCTLPIQVLAFLNVDSEGYPVQPYGFKNNPNSILDDADIVFVNPVNTGYSRMLPNKEGEMPDREQFFGINEDIKYLAGWINTFVSRKKQMGIS